MLRVEVNIKFVCYLVDRLGHCCLPHPNHRVAIEIGRWLTIPISRDKKLSRFSFEKVVETLMAYGANSGRL